MDLRKLTVSELDQLIDRAKKRKLSISEDRVRRVREKITAILKAEGLTLAEVFGGTLGKSGDGKPGAKGAPAAKPAAKSSDRRYQVKPKYRNPDNAAETWAGRGAQPRWMAAALARGHTLEDMLIR